MRPMLDAQGSPSHTFAYAWQNASLAAKGPTPVIARRVAPVTVKCTALLTSCIASASTVIREQPSLFSC